MNPRFLVIGYGSPIRGDDALGPMVAERLLDLDLPADVDILIRQTLTPDLAGNLNDAEMAIFIDASTDGPAGELVCRRVVADPNASLAMVHFLNPAGLLSWTRQVYGRAPQAYVLSFRGENFDFHNYRLTPAVEAAVQPMAERACALIYAVKNCDFSLLGCVYDNEQ